MKSPVFPNSSRKKKRACWFQLFNRHALAFFPWLFNLPWRPALNKETRGWGESYFWIDDMRIERGRQRCIWLVNFIIVNHATVSTRGEDQMDITVRQGWLSLNLLCNANPEILISGRQMFRWFFCCSLATRWRPITVLDPNSIRSCYHIQHSLLGHLRPAKSSGVALGPFFYRVRPFSSKQKNIEYRDILRNIQFTQR